jgi:hypothetical protein
VDANRSFIENIIWYEMIHAKYWEQYLSDYTGLKITKRKWLNITILMLSTIGASSWSAWKLLPEGTEWLPSVIFGIMGVVQVFNVFQKNITVENTTLESLYRLRSMYISYFNKLERLFIESEAHKYSQNELIEKYYKIRETVYPIEELKDSLNITQIEMLDKNIEGKVMNYLNSRFYPTES